jgi:hypothetical protein
MRSFVLIIAFFLTSWVAMAQNAANTELVWSVQGLTDLSGGDTTHIASYTCVFETDGANNGYWRQKNGTFSTKIIVDELVGTWSDVSLPGKITLQVRMDGQAGTLVFEKEANGTFVLLNLSQTDGSSITYRFNVTQINPL